MVMAVFLVSPLLSVKIAAAQTYKFYVASEATIMSAHPVSTFPCYGYTMIGTFSTSLRYFAKLDLSNAPSASTISRAVFRMNRIQSTSDNDDNYVLYAATSSWSDKSVSWTDQPTYVVTSIKGVKDDNGFFNFDITNLVKNWVNSPSSNFGFMIRKELEQVPPDQYMGSNQGMFVCAAWQQDENTDSILASKMPVLEITSSANLSINNTPILSPLSSTTSTVNSGSTSSSSSSSSSTNNPVVNSPSYTNSSVVIGDTYKSIVKIKTFTLDEDYNLSEDSYGSGVIINSSGLVLTNSHVVSVKDSFDNSDQDASYEICLPNNTTDEPDCSYIGKLIAKNDDLDVALLQIMPIAGLSSRTSYPYLTLNQTDNTNTNDAVTAIGYPSVGGGSITVTTGIVSGKVDKYDKQWIKTDAVISFGSSGGAALDQNNKVIGITSAGHSDLLGSLGYIINITSLNQWISANQNLKPKTSPLASRVITFAKKEISLNDSNNFTNDNPPFSVTKPDDWTFEYLGENLLYIQNPSDEEGGYIIIQLKRFPYLVDINNILPRVKMRSLEKGTLSLLNIQENKDVKISGVAAKRIRDTDMKDSLKFYVLPFRNNLVYLNYDYGTDDKDKEIVENIINSFKVKNIKFSFSELKKYSNNTPKFNLTVDKDWAILTKGQKSTPLEIYNKKYKDLNVRVSVTKTNDEVKNLSNDEFLKLYKDQFAQANKLTSLIDLKAEITESNAHYKVNKNFTDTIKIVTAIKTPSNGKTIAYKATFSKKIGDKYILDVILITTNPDKKAFTNYQKEFLKMLQNFSL